MGIDTNGSKLLLYAKHLGVNFEKVVTIGRQGLHLTPEQLLKQIVQFKIESPKNIKLIESTFCEPFFSLLGAHSVESIDYSDYEKATIIHDMNQPLPIHLKKSASIVFDGGTLEHVFNYPMAMKNSMQLLRTGGHFISVTPANNFMGHGFYQFSPELFFSIFTPKNGFLIEKMIVCEDYEGAKWYEVNKPKGGFTGRVTLINNHPTYLMCIARRLDETIEPFLTNPFQSDYIEMWNNTNVETQISNNGSFSSLLQPIKLTLKSIPVLVRIVRNCRYLFTRKYPKRDYKLLDPL